MHINVTLHGITPLILGRPGLGNQIPFEGPVIFENTREGHLYSVGPNNSWPILKGTLLQCVYNWTNSLNGNCLRSKKDLGVSKG